MSTSTDRAKSFREHPLPSSIDAKAIDNLPDAPLSADNSFGTGMDTLDWPKGMSTVTLSTCPAQDFR